MDVMCLDTKAEFSLALHCECSNVHLCAGIVFAFSCFNSGAGAAGKNWQLESSAGLCLKLEPGRKSPQLSKLVPTISSLGEKCQTLKGLLWLLLLGMREGNDT